MRKSFHRHPNPQALILRICLNAAYDTVRDRKRRSREEALANHEDCLASAESDPAEALTRNEEHAKVLEAISRLSRSQAVAVLMRLVEELPYYLRHINPLRAVAFV